MARYNNIIACRGGSRKNERGGLVERGEAPYEGGGATQGVGMGGGASPSRLAGGEIFCFLQFAHTFTFELSY